MSLQIVPIRFRHASAITLGWNNLVLLAAALLGPLSLVLTLWVTAFVIEGHLTAKYLVLSMLVLALTLPGKVLLTEPVRDIVRSIFMNWAVIAALLLFFGYASGLVAAFDPKAITMWLWLAPTGQLAVHLTLRKFAPALAAIQGKPKRAVIVGVTENSLTLAQEIQQDRYNGTKFVGFFDDRTRERIENMTDLPLLGRISDIQKSIREQGVDAIYIALPMVTQPRILQLLDELCDTTASIYLVPDIFVTDLMKARMDSVGQIPVIAMCETPFVGTNNMVKRCSDIFLSLMIVLLISPLLVAIAIGIKLTSPGPIIFRQRRYGLNGEEILVNKFRTMTVCEDGPQVKQAQRDDSRFTKIGAFLRRTSLDELPQFFNVLQGSMSIVGPRPHAVAHNELYRTMIKGYMIRHKAKPGITGWAQVNGWRGETDTLDKMKKRIEYDLEYLRNWSLRLDLYIIFKTILVTIKDNHAY